MFNELIADLKKGLDEFEDNKLKCMQDIGNSLMTKTQKLTPVNTGNLKKSYTVATDKDEVVLNNEAKYFDCVNDGHATRGGGFVTGKHMAEKGLSQMPVVIAKEVNELLNKTRLM